MTALFLGSSELTAWAKPVRSVRVLSPPADDGQVRVTVDPPAPDGSSELVLSPRFEGDTIGSTALPLVVNILDLHGTHVGIGELYASEAEAAATDGGAGT